MLLVTAVTKKPASIRSMVPCPVAGIMEENETACTNYR
jgi:hypothetical protein